MSVALNSILGIAIGIVLTVGNVSGEMHPNFASDPVRGAGVLAQELESRYWQDNAQDQLRKLVAANARGTAQKAKNIIMFLGDGMSLPTVSATRVYLGGEQESLSFERFPHFGLSKVSLINVVAEKS